MTRPARPWFRVYVEMYADRKIRRLTPAQRWIWVAVLGAARESHSAGQLYVAPGMPMSADELADYAGVARRDVPAALAAMERLSMIEVDEAGTITVCNWGSRQFESDDVTARTQAHRERSKERSNDVPGNAPETETETETEETHTSTPVDDAFERFWAAYPRRVAKGAARKAWKAAIKKADPTSLVEAASSYTLTAANIEPRFVKHPASWLNGECWADEDGTVHTLPGDGTVLLPPLPPKSPWG